MIKQRIVTLLLICVCGAVLLSGGAAEGMLDGEEAARSFAAAFFASPYVGESQDGRMLTVEQTETGWHAVLADEAGTRPALSLWFAADGRIAQYQNSAFTLPVLDHFTVEGDNTMDSVWMIDMLRDALFPNMNNHACGVYARDGDAVFYAVDLFTEWLGIVMDGETPKIVAYGDLGTDDARYPGYLTRKEAAAVAVAALAQAYGADTDLQEHLVLIQGEFTLQAHQWTDADVALPYWFFVFGDETDDGKSQYTALIDAQTGEVLETHDPSDVGNG